MTYFKLTVTLISEKPVYSLEESVIDKNRAADPATNQIAYSIESCGEIITRDNGDPTSFVPFPSHERGAFSALALVNIGMKTHE